MRFLDSRRMSLKRLKRSSKHMSTMMTVFNVYLNKIITDHLVSFYREKTYCLSIKVKGC